MKIKFKAGAKEFQKLQIIRKKERLYKESKQQI